ncbi:MAG: hypothetical protein WBC51_08565 [Vicinamibacterales bacterium]|jgi:hypothetical protein
MDEIAYPRMHSDRRHAPSREALLRRIRAEFCEMPSLRLTCHQAQRLFALPCDICERVLVDLVRENTLTLGPDGRYGLRGNVGWELSEGDVAECHERS